MQELLKLLVEFYAPNGAERVGFILDDGAIVEVENVATNPEEAFDVCSEDLITFGERAVASWHTHPGGSANLSVQDDSAFHSWSNLDHYVIGSDAIKKYTVIGNAIVQETYPSPRPAEEALV